MFELRMLRTVIVVTVVVLLSACASSPPPTQTPTMSASDAYQASRYSIQQDRGPAGELDVRQIREVVPAPVRRTSAGNRSPYTVNGRTYQVMRSEEGYNERGFASWYGEKFHGHKTSNGETYDMFQLSAAHKSMPIPGFLRVTNLENNRSIIVRVNDRGPFHSDRVIDLSYAAAYMLGFHNKGTAMVHIEAIVPPATPILANQSAPVSRAPLENAPMPATVPGGAGQFLQVGAFSDLRAAEQLSEKLRSLTTRPVFIRSVENEERQSLHRVRVGPIPDAAELARITNSVVAADLGRPYAVRD
ncbi:MAG: septal ring lytic transglycosylase RlpA family protein [Gammaproteobacteria bacterium]|nr:septal ring lytic transglycosylase RlpA family protein [Gammaproteobacteria bacterium]MDP2141934.1 septal ring lytic transglycosylase RlpA family protein [Gammaproteobacteria bacterium]MDP2347184.1 septal ring lytic transglycosylase RlpA family protein [Gammaproteobacteria bacterium]